MGNAFNRKVEMLKRQGLGGKDIAEKLGIPDRFSMDIIDKDYEEREESLIVKLYLMGVEIGYIAKTLNISRTKINSLCRAFGYTVNDRLNKECAIILQYNLNREKDILQIDQLCKKYNMDMYTYEAYSMYMKTTFNKNEKVYKTLDMYYSGTGLARASFENGIELDNMIKILGLGTPTRDIIKHEKLVRANKKRARHEEVIRLYNEGISISEICRRLHIGDTTINKIVRENGCVLRENKYAYKLYTDEQIMEMLESKKEIGLSKTCEKYGVSATYLHRHAKRLNVESEYKNSLKNRLTKKDMRNIKKMAENGESKDDIAKHYNIAKSSVYRVLSKNI